jgi:hypothetical protein
MTEYVINLASHFEYCISVKSFSFLVQLLGILTLEKF